MTYKQYRGLKIFSYYFQSYKSYFTQRNSTINELTLHHRNRWSVQP